MIAQQMEHMNMFKKNIKIMIKLNFIEMNIIWDLVKIEET